MLGGTGTPFGQKPTTTPNVGLFSQSTTPSAPSAMPSAAPTGFSLQPQPQQQGFTGISFPQISTTQSQPLSGFQLPTATSTAAPNVSLFGTSLLGGNQNKSAFPAAGFGAPAQTTASTIQPSQTFGFAAPKPTASAPAPATSATPGLAFNFGAPAATTSTAAPTLNFGLGNTTATTAAPSLVPSTTPATTTTGVSLGFNLNAAAPTTTSTGLTFGTAIPATSTPTLSFGNTSTTTSTPLTFGLTATPAVTSSAPVGVPTLGGLGGTTSFNIGKGTTIATKPDQLKANPLTSLTAAPNQTQAPNYKDDLIPPELMLLVESFKTFVKDQKSSSSVVNRASLKQITKVTEDAELLKRMTLQLERNVNKNKALNRKLREDVARGIQDSEIVQRLSMDPRGFPIDNSLAFEYFRNIVDRFQQQSESLTVELKNMEKHIVCKLNPAPFTPEELSAIMKQLYECFVALAGRYQSIHSSVTSLKLEMRRKKDPWYSLNSSGPYQTNTLLNM